MGFCTLIGMAFLVPILLTRDSGRLVVVPVIGVCGALLSFLQSGDLCAFAADCYGSVGRSVIYFLLSENVRILSGNHLLVWIHELVLLLLTFGVVFVNDF